MSRIAVSSYPAVASARPQAILGDKGEVTGIIGNTAIHIRPNRADEKAPKVHELWVDVGASSAKEVAELGLRVGLGGRVWPRLQPELVPDLLAIH